jgi:hypothetical protein
MEMGEQNKFSQIHGGGEGEGEGIKIRRNGARLVAQQNIYNLWSHNHMGLHGLFTGIAFFKCINSYDSGHSV